VGAPNKICVTRASAVDPKAKSKPTMLAITAVLRALARTERMSTMTFPFKFRKLQLKPEKTFERGLQEPSYIWRDARRAMCKLPKSTVLLSGVIRVFTD
jgi:hypothetical protein